MITLSRLTSNRLMGFQIGMPAIMMLKALLDFKGAVNLLLEKAKAYTSYLMAFPAVILTRFA